MVYRMDTRVRWLWNARRAQRCSLVRGWQHDRLVRTSSYVIVVANTDRGIIGPLLVSRGLAFGRPILNKNPIWEGLLSYYSLDGGFASLSHPSPRYWLMWPGILCMVVVALTGKGNVLRNDTASKLG